MSKYLSFKYQLKDKKISALAKAVQKIDFWGPILGVVPKTSGEKLRL